MMTFSQFDRTPLDIAMANGRTDIAQMLQLAHHTDIGGVSESETITIETTEPIITETVTTSAGIFQAVNLHLIKRFCRVCWDLCCVSISCYDHFRLLMLLHKRGPHGLTCAV